jgi:GT2 family glycosyltransferase
MRRQAYGSGGCLRTSAGRGRKRVLWPAAQPPSKRAENDLGWAPLFVPREDSPRSGTTSERGVRSYLDLPVTIVVPVHDAADELERCLASLVRNTTGPARLLLIDDASSEPRTAEVLARYAGYSNVELLVNEENLGFTRTVNRALAHAKRDVVLLNSDTEVPPGWLGRLVEAAAGDERIATVTAISDNAGAYSVPRINERNRLPDHLSGDEIGRLVAQDSLRLRPWAPTGNGFCMYMKRAALAEVGFFDADRFPRGYGEENDFSMRAAARGWHHAVDDSTFVIHARTASFGAEKERLMPSGRTLVSELHPEYDGLVRRFARSRAMKRVRTRICKAFAAAEANGRRPRPRVLVVVQEGSRGVAATTEDLVRGLADRWDCLVLTSNTKTLKLWRDGEDALECIDRWNPPGRWRPTSSSRPTHSAIVWKILTRYAIEVIHVRQLPEHETDLQYLARELAIPMLLEGLPPLEQARTPSLAEASERYDALYRGVLDDARPFRENTRVAHGPEHRGRACA